MGSCLSHVAGATTLPDGMTEKRWCDGIFCRPPTSKALAASHVVWACGLVSPPLLEVPHGIDVFPPAGLPAVHRSRVHRTDGRSGAGGRADRDPPAAAERGPAGAFQLRPAGGELSP